jgi:TonB family protein
MKDHVQTPGFELLKAGDAPVFNHLRLAAVVLAVVLVAVAGRVIWYFSTARVDLGTSPIEQIHTPESAAPPPGAVSKQDDTVYFSDPDIVLPVLESKVEPKGDAEATVTVLALINPAGRPIQARVWRGVEDDNLNKLALRAAGQWRFKPGMKNGKPIPVYAQLEIRVGKK